MSDDTLVTGDRLERSREAAEPQRLGGYVVLGTLGRGAMGTVLDAFDRALDRRVAVKVLHHELSERHRARLVREAQALARLSHPNVVHVYEVGESEGRIYIAMELVPGRSLREWLAQAPRPSWRECVHAFVQAGEGLAAAHAEGLVHRDFKPDNAVIDDKGRVRVLDFGLARQIEDTEGSHGERASTGAEPSADDPALATSLTGTGTVLGTLAYMPLEQMHGQPTDARSDQFSFCVALHEALYGERPFEGRSMNALMIELSVGKVRPAPKGTAVPDVLRKAVLRGLARDPADRWPSMDALLAELRRAVAPRRRAWWAAGVAAGLAALGVGLARYAAVGFRCEGARAQLEGTWDDTRRQELRAAILGTELAYAPDTWARVEPRLDEYAEAWIAKHTEVCEATSVRQEQSPAVMDLRMECLRARRVALREAVGVLAQADERRVERAVELVTGLPALSRCDDVEALRAELRPPEDVEVAAQVEALRRQLARVSALDEVGAFVEGLALADAAVEQAEALGYAPLQAEALLQRSWLHGHADRLADAERDAERAYLLAAEHGHDEVEARAADALTWFVGYEQGRVESGRQWGKTALALSKAPGIEPLAEANALVSLGMVLKEAGELNAALECLRRALAIREGVAGEWDLRVASTLEGLANVLIAQRQLPEALGHLQRVLQVRERVLGSEHPGVASTLGNIGSVLNMERRFAEALGYQQRALGIRQRTLGEQHSDVAVSLNNIGNVLAHLGRADEALAHYRRAAVIAEQVLGEGHPSVVAAWINIGTTLVQMGRLDEALAHDRRILASLEQRWGPRHALVAYALVGLVTVALAQDDFAAAREHAERALAIREAGETSPDLLVEARMLLAEALWPDPRERARARALAQQAHDAQVQLGEAGKPVVTAIETWLAEHPLPRASAGGADGVGGSLGAPGVVAVGPVDR